MPGSQGSEQLRRTQKNKIAATKGAHGARPEEQGPLPQRKRAAQRTETTAFVRPIVEFANPLQIVGTQRELAREASAGMPMHRRPESN